MVYKQGMETRRFVIPDIHGCAATFRTLLEAVGFRKGDRLHLLGDLIDRGPRSRDVLDLVLDLRACGFSVECIRGNHEQMLLDAPDSPGAFREWLLNGGYATLDSFGIDRVSEIPRRYTDFIAAMPCYMELDGFILVHAGMNFGIPDPYSDTWSMLWSRSETIDRRRAGNRRMICGHTPHSRETIRRSLAADVITLDNGCVYRERPGLGQLTALELGTMKLTFQENID
jgi:serine/threonine protein phosphatase 1